MGARSVQISLDEELLERLDRRKETRARGRSAVIRQALRLYLDRERRSEIDEAYARAYQGRADDVWSEFGPLLGAQRWPRK